MELSKRNIIGGVLGFCSALVLLLGFSTKSNILSGIWIVVFTLIWFSIIKIKSVK